MIELGQYAILCRRCSPLRFEESIEYKILLREKQGQ